MSADNWAICPFCVADARAEYDRRVREVNDAYGKVTADEYRVMDAALPDEFDPYSVKPSLREDYEVGFNGAPDDTEGLLIYKARCECGASVEVDTTVKLTRPDGATS